MTALLCWAVCLLMRTAHSDRLSSATHVSSNDQILKQVRHTFYAEDDINKWMSVSAF